MKTAISEIGTNRHGRITWHTVSVLEGKATSTFHNIRLAKLSSI
jgi:hypothetical protein